MPEVKYLWKPQSQKELEEEVLLELKRKMEGPETTIFSPDPKALDPDTDDIDNDDIAEEINFDEYGSHFEDVSEGDDEM